MRSFVRPPSSRQFIRRTGLLDWDYVRAQLAPLVELKEAPEILARLEQRRVELEQ